MTITIAIDEELFQRLRYENDVMRKIIADADLPCMYCQLSRPDMSKCKLDFPGCARADDMMIEPQKPTSASGSCPICT